MKTYGKVHISNMTICCHKSKYITYGKHNFTICKYCKKVYHMWTYGKTYGIHFTIYMPFFKDIQYVDIWYN